MKTEQKKEIEARWQRLLAGKRKPRKPTPAGDSTVVNNGASVVRRRKGATSHPPA